MLKTTAEMTLNGLLLLAAVLGTDYTGNRRFLEPGRRILQVPLLCPPGLGLADVRAVCPFDIRYRKRL